MRLRHKQPTLVSMWMLDVFCCALGCVILLLLLKMREANITAEESNDVRSELIDTRMALFESDSNNLTLGAEVSDRDGKLARIQKQRDELAKSLALVRTERDKTATELALVLKERDETSRELALMEMERQKAAKELALIRTEVNKAAKNLAAIEEKLKTSQTELALAKKKIDDNAKSLALAKERDADNDEELARKKAEIAELSKKVAEKEKARAESIRQVLDYNGRLVAAEAKLKNSEKLLDELMSKKNEAGKLRSRVAELESQLADDKAQIVDLQGTRAKLADKVNQLQIEADQRFAGIAMTGRNVVFLVDMSGSMDRTDENTVDATKWPTVRETLLKVMRSLPNLEQYQVILFSSKFSYLMHNEGEWLRYEKEKSLERVRRAMTATTPEGDTNLYAAFEETFKLRGKGLDTIYLFSDGLPTSGPGLTPNEERTLTESGRGMILAKNLRRSIKYEWNSPNARGQRVKINSVGFFYESPDVGAFLWALSRDNDGSFVGMSRP